MQMIPESLERVFKSQQEPHELFTALMPTMVEVLGCDRCFLYLRFPETKIGRIAYCWCRTPEFPNVSSEQWEREPENLASEDPLFAAALRTENSVFVEDVETASPQVLNREFESQNFGHRALIHAHLCQENRLWGILQPCVFNKPRIWSETDRFIIDWVVKKITPLAVDYGQLMQ